MDLATLAFARIVCRWFTAWGITLACLVGPSAHALEPINLQLKYLHQFQFAGYYAALEKGYYREAGLDVTIAEGHTGDEPLANVLAGTSQFGVGSSGLLLARQAGKPVVVLAVVFQHSPYVLLAPQTGPTQGIHDIIGKRVMLAAQSEDLVAYLKKEGISVSDFTKVEHSFNPDDLISGKVYGFSAYATNETDYLDKKGFAYQAYTPRSAGIDFYGDNLFTSEREIANHPARVKAFRQASMRGWQYAMAHPEELVDLILAKYSKRNSREHLLYEARQMQALVQPVLVEMGYMNPGRWQHIGSVYADLGMLPKGISLAGFLYDPDPRPDFRWVFWGLAVVLLSATAAWAVHLKRLKRERERAQARIQVSEERLAFALDGAGYGVWDWDIAGGTVLYSDRWLQMHGFQREDIPERLEGWEQRVHPDDVALFKANMLDYFAGKTDTFTAEHRALCKDGSWKWVVDRGRVVRRDAAGKPLRMVCTHADITARKEQEEQLRLMNETLETRVAERTAELQQVIDRLKQTQASLVQADKMASLGALVAGVAHELNTPIGNSLTVASTMENYVKGFESDVAKGLTRSALDNFVSSAREGTDILMRSLHRAAELVSSFKQVAVDQTSTNRRRFDLRQTVDEIMLTLGPTIRKTTHRVVIDIPADITMESYPGPLGQVLTNMVNNALFHGFEGRENGTITIAAEVLVDDRVRLTVQDDGVGIPSTHLGRVFDPFFTTKLGKGGSGLGLNITYNLVHDRLGGTVQVQSQVGQGTCFTLLLPLVAPLAETQPAGVTTPV
ncbi:ABC transporter substrate-binding protein [Rhodoferax sp. AJA081-3]|uniref:ABC transporter substrate-binding protein n=1 Tax=Rhodoferax sp. AJA081-3 TaxID=2752316 RepID=UPI001AE087E2|nr:ABC transporter substrate-binding protein [Rhodoferax sp. AJA081-3]QTN29129.1 ABC transporter substrate-binding protein [Rhodoferax sp. AJA081-3]